MSTHAKSRLSLRIDVEKWPLQAPFHITGYTMTAAEVVVVTLEQDGLMGRGEATGVYYFDDDCNAMLARLEKVRPTVENGINRDSLQHLLPPGGARNALDCALWDLDAKRLGTPAWQLAGLPAPVPKITAHTLSAGSPEQMARGARAYTRAKLIKLKLTGEPVDAERVRAVRTTRPDVALIVDANQGFTPETLGRLLPLLCDAQVQLIEQPFKVGQEALLDLIDSPIPFGADESAQTSQDVARLAAHFDVINIKLDKSGGLTEALAMAQEARRHDLDVMVGNMTGTSLAMAPAFLVAQGCRFVDLDGPLFLCDDRTVKATYTDGAIWCPESLWGGTAGDNAQ